MSDMEIELYKKFIRQQMYVKRSLIDDIYMDIV